MGTNIITDPTALTPVELRGGRYYKREDLHGSDKYPVNGSKFRACRHLIAGAVLEGATHVVSASSVLSPQAAMAGVLAEEYGMDCTLVLGATRPETAQRHVSVQVALAAGAKLDTSTKVGYNPMIQRAGQALARQLPGGWQLPYGITTPAGADPAQVRAFLEVGGAQVQNIPTDVDDLVMAFGSGNTAAGVLYGLAKHATSVKRVHLIGVGPDRLEWAQRRLATVGVNWDDLPQVLHTPLHGWYANYSDKMRETADGIVMHPTYEGKVVRFLNGTNPAWWGNRDGRTLLWIIGGPL